MGKNFRGPFTANNMNICVKLWIISQIHNRTARRDRRKSRLSRRPVRAAGKITAKKEIFDKTQNDGNVKLLTF